MAASQIMSLRRPTCVNAPGNGGATARTRFLAAAAPFCQSMSPSAGLRRPKRLALASSWACRGAVPAMMSGSQRWSMPLAASTSLSCSERPVSSVEMCTTCWQTMSPASAFATM